MASKRLRWWIVWTLFGSTVVNYISRQTFSVLAPIITQELHLTHTDLSRVFSAFQISYAGMWLIGGVLLDIIGTRLGLALAVIWWSGVSMLTGLANSVFSFGASSWTGTPLLARQRHIVSSVRQSAVWLTGRGL
ncbi:MAG: hypothetical protein LAO04_19110, partial [Acidobacteriia bacterium]|nr:hypothetical protein [Terriglobia bacterium]